MRAILNNPEVVGQLGLGEIPPVNPEYSRVLGEIKNNLGMVAPCLGIVGVVGFSTYFSMAEKANAVDNSAACVTSSGATPVAIEHPKFTGVDVVIDPFVRSTQVLCVGSQSVMETNIHNDGDIPAQAMQFVVVGDKATMNSISSIRRNEEELPIKTFGVDTFAPGDRVCIKAPTSDRLGNDTRYISCGLNYWDHLDPGSPWKISITMTPSKISKSSSTGPYLKISGSDYPITEQPKALFNNESINNLEVRDSLGNPYVEPPKPQPCVGPKLIVTNVDLPGNRWMLKASITSSGAKINSIGNGASKILAKRKNAARIRVMLPKATKLGRLGRNMRKVSPNELDMDVTKNITTANGQTRVVSYIGRRISPRNVSLVVPGSKLSDSGLTCGRTMIFRRVLGG